MTDPTLRRLLVESFEVLRTDLPPSYGALCRRLDRLAIEIRVDGEGFVVRFSESRAGVADISGSTDAHIETSVGCILAVIDGAIDLSEAVMRHEVRVVGALSVVTRLHEGILAYVHGAVRCPAFPELLRRLRSLSGNREMGDRP